MLLLEHTFWSHRCHTCKRSYCLHETWWWLIVVEFQNGCSKRFEFWLVDTVIVIDRFPLLGRASKILMNHPWPEKSQPACPSSNRSKWDVIVARMKAQISNFVCPVRHMACTYAWRKREIVFWSINCSFPSRFYCFLYNF